MAIARIRKNDTVIVISGNDAGKTGTVMSVDTKKQTAIVGGLNVHKKAVRRTEKQAGGLIDRELHPVYGQVVTHTKKFHAHDESDAVKVGDKVTIMETRPLSATKRWRIVAPEAK